MKRVILLLHRYLGIATCLIVAAWCLSGFVMMYVGFPRFSAQDRIASLSPLDFANCCDFTAVRTAAPHNPIDAFEIEMLTGRPVLRLNRGVTRTLIDLRRGVPISGVDGATALQIALDFERAAGTTGSPHFEATIERDQWTVSGEYTRDRPFHKIDLGDLQGTEVYVSTQSGEIVQRTTAHERFWNYPGAITHWVYMTPLRAHTRVWAQLVIWLSLLGVCLTIAGVILGFLQIRIDSRSLPKSPYVGVRFWHHVCGVLFGMAAIAWVGSGLLSMNPWGLLDSDYGADEEAGLRQAGLTSTAAIDAAEHLVREENLPRLTGGGQLLQLASAPLGHSLWILATGDKSRTRFAPQTLAPAPLASSELLAALRYEHPGQTPTSAELLNAGDDYYYSDHDIPFKPAYRVEFNNTDHSRYYFDPVSGALLLKFDRAARGYRWLFSAIHRWDFSPAIRHRPLWDLVVGALLLGVTASSITGVVLGFRRLTSRTP
jgi:uncharacterized iron-regulated membrane protein